GGIGRRFPDFLARFRVQGDDAGILAADVDEEQATLDGWRRRDAEESLRRLVVVGQRAIPNFLARCQFQAVHLALRPECVDVLPWDQWWGGGAGVEIEIVHVFGGICELPLLLAVGSVEAFDNSLVAHAMEEDQSAARHDRAAPAFADGALPGDTRA